MCGCRVRVWRVCDLWRGHLSLRVCGVQSVTVWADPLSTFTWGLGLEPRLSGLPRQAALDG